MHNIHRIRFIGLVFCLTIITSCKKDFLDLVPKGKQLAGTVNDYNLLFNNLAFFQLFGADCQLISGDDVMTFDPAFANTANPKYKNCFLWADNVYDQPDQDAGEMTAMMKPLYTTNKIASEVMMSTNGSDRDRKMLKAEALANRAWFYLMLINYYGKPYTASSAATDPGYPIITEADVTTTAFKRASVQEVYDFIIKDLTDAIPDLPADLTSRIRMSKWAAECILGKAYWYMGKYTEALAQFNAAFTGLASGTRLPVRLYNLTTEMHGGVYDYNAATMPFTTYITGLREDADEESLLSRTVSTVNMILFADYMLAPWARNLYTPSDQRINFFTANQFFSFFLSPTPNNAYGDLRRFGPVAINMGMSLPDLYLMRAECKARTADLSGAITDLETLRNKRMNATEAVVPSGLTQKQLVQFILDERTREFAATGYRWFDMRRIAADPMFSGTTFTHLYKKSSTETQTLTLKTERLTFRFPQKVMAQNPGMENNP